jgi:hypothetical protein
MFYSIIKDEVDNNPKNITGLSWAQSEEWIRDTLNTPGISGEIIARELVNTADIMTAIFSDVTEFNSLTQLEVSKLNLLAPIGTIDPSVLQAVFLDMFPAGEGNRPVIRAALIALATRDASRTEKLYSAGIKLSIKDVHIARRLP